MLSGLIFVGRVFHSLVSVSLILRRTRLLCVGIYSTILIDVATGKISGSMFFSVLGADTQGQGWARTVKGSTGEGKAGCSSRICLVHEEQRQRVRRGNNRQYATGLEMRLGDQIWGEEEKFRSEATFFPGPLASLADLASGFLGNPVLICNDFRLKLVIFFPDLKVHSIALHFFYKSISNQICSTYILICIIIHLNKVQISLNTISNVISSMSDFR